MKKARKSAVILAGLSFAAAILAGCPSKNSPSNPSSNPTSTFTPTITSTPTVTATVVTDWWAANIQFQDGTSNGSAAYFYIQVNGQPATTAGVTLSSVPAGVSIPLTYTGSTINEGAPGIFADYYANHYTPLQGGQTYVLSSTALGQTASATLVAPGPISLGTDSSNGNAITQVSWTHGGTTSGSVSVFVNETSPGSTTTFNTSSGVVTSPVNINESTAYPGGFGSQYLICPSVYNVFNSVSNATLLNGIVIYDDFCQSVTLTTLNVTAPTTLTTGQYNCSYIHLSGAGVLYISGAVTLDVANYVTVDAGCTITGLGMGYAAGLGPGAPGSGNGGAGHGGPGGSGSAGSGGTAYDSASLPVSMGSGGGNDCSGGGAGGAFLSILNPGGAVTLNGTISMNGANGDTGCGAAGGGGGAGGTIYIQTGLFTGVGTGYISVSGGMGAGTGGGGGGGGIMVTSDTTNSYIGTGSDSGGTGSGTGAAGSPGYVNGTH